MVLFTVASSVTFQPRSAAAAPAVVAFNAELRAEPSSTSAVVAVVPTGGEVVITGAPENGYYPVSYLDGGGWLSSAALVITKDPEPTLAPPAEPAMAWETAPAPAAPTLPAQVAEPIPTATVTSVSTGEVAPSPTAVPQAAPLPSVVPPVDPTAAATTAPAPTEGAVVAGAPPPVATAPAIATSESASIATPATEPIATTAPTPTATTQSVATATLEPAATATPEPSPTPTAEPETRTTLQLDGPATATEVVPLRAGPRDGDQLLFSVPAGSTVWRTGRYSNGWVSADYMGIVGWVRADLLAEPLAVAPEPTPSRATEAVPTGVGGPTGSDGEIEGGLAPVSRPGSGTSYALREISLRSGPSAAYESMATIAAGTPVVLTGVMENGFVRIEHGGQIGWVAFDLLSHPAAPTPATHPRGEDSRRVYSRSEIIDVIYAAADRYGQPRADMLRVAECESNLDPYAVNASGSYGLFQFISSTWESTPYANRNIFDPRANANAAAWMWSQGRRAEWVCK
ncbi:MAG: SH3 domain-containing protein [Chloroflexota bacterium]|nr:SH3 domain-containing protein [Chloroflexota bacterium]